LSARADDLAADSYTDAVRGAGELATAAELAGMAQDLSDAGVAQAVAAGAEVGAAAMEGAVGEGLTEGA
jgi:hypothetical protein